MQPPSSGQQLWSYLQLLEAGPHHITIPSQGHAALRQGTTPKPIIPITSIEIFYPDSVKPVFQSFCQRMWVFFPPGPVWTTDRAAAICAGAALLSRHGLQHVRAQQAGTSPLLPCPVSSPLPPLPPPLLLVTQVQYTSQGCSRWPAYHVRCLVLYLVHLITCRIQMKANNNGLHCFVSIRPASNLFPANSVLYVYPQPCLAAQIHGVSSSVWLCPFGPGTHNNEYWCKGIHQLICPVTFAWCVS